ncbi:hypothetical protein JCM10207_001058 [Rhodosporidiobolus poonsookiae]
MQNLAAYGSDSEDEGQQPAGVAQAQRELQSVAEPSTASPAVTAPLARIKGAATTSRGQTPLAGVRLPPSASTSTRPPPSPASLGKRRESSTSPPPYERTRREEPEGDRSPGPSRLQQAGAPSGVRLDALSEFGLPPAPTGPCKPSVEVKLANFHNLRQTRGLHFNDSLHASKAFRNPRIYAKLVEFVSVDETGTNWDREVWDPKGLGPEASASRLAELQKVRSEAKAAQPAGSRSSIAFASSSASASRSRDDGRSRYKDDRDRDRDRDRAGGGERKKSRWDKGGRDRSRSPRRR